MAKPRNKGKKRKIGKKRPTRRSVSITGLNYQRLKGYCDATGSSVSGWLEKTITEKLDAAGVPVPTVLKPRPLAVQTTDGVVSQHFTF